MIYVRPQSPRRMTITPLKINFFGSFDHSPEAPDPDEQPQLSFSALAQSQPKPASFEKVWYLTYNYPIIKQLCSFA